MDQIPFQWPGRVSYEPDDFIVSQANAQAAHFIDTPAQKAVLLLTGPACSGKTHLAHRWAARWAAVFIDPAQLGHAPSAQLWQGKDAAILDGIEGCDETALFHLLRHAETQGLSLLLTAALPAGQLSINLPDLKSRLVAAPCAAILPPDEALLHAFLLKQTADKQWRVSEPVIAYIIRRMERSFFAAHMLVDKMEQHLALHKCEITIPMVKSLLELTIS